MAATLSWHQCFDYLGSICHCGNRVNNYAHRDYHGGHASSYVLFGLSNAIFKKYKQVLSLDHTKRKQLMTLTLRRHLLVAYIMFAYLDYHVVN